MKDPLVLLPAMMCDARVFSHQINALSRDRAVMVAPLTQGERIEEIASSLLDLMPHKFALFGLSFGGLVAMEVLRRAPERITRLGLMGCSPLAETPAEAAAREPQIIAARTGRLPEALAQALPPDDLAPGPERLTTQALQAEMAQDLGADVFVRQSRALQRSRDQQGTLRRFKLPALVACGAQDTRVPIKRHAFIAELMPNAELQVIEGAGHLPPLEQPEATLKVMQNWLDGPLVLR